MQPSLGKQTYHGKCNANAPYSSNARFSIYSLSLCPGTSSGIRALSEHVADRIEALEGERLAIEVLPVPGAPSAGVESGDGALDDPRESKRQNFFGLIGVLDGV